MFGNRVTNCIIEFTPKIRKYAKSCGCLLLISDVRHCCSSRKQEQEYEYSDMHWISLHLIDLNTCFLRQLPVQLCRFMDNALKVIGASLDFPSFPHSAAQAIVI